MNNQRILSSEEIDYFVNLKDSDIGKKFIIDNFAKTFDKVNKKIIFPKYHSYDIITIPKGKYGKNDKPIKTTLGMFLFNKYFFEEELIHVIPYINKQDDGITNDDIGDIEFRLSKALANKQITPNQMATYLNKIQWFFAIADLVIPSITAKTGEPLKEVEDFKAKLLKEKKAEIESGDPIEAAKIEKQLIAKAKEVIGNDPGMDLYNSGSNASFANNYKTMFLMKGPVKDTATGKYTTITSNFIDGVDKSELHPFFDSLVYGAYSKGVGVQVAGYLTKKIIAAFQSIVVDKPGSDCGTTRTLDIILSDYDYDMFVDCYIVENGKLKLLTAEDKSKYVGKLLHIRFPMYCTSDKICSKCAGEYYYKLGIENMGLTTIKASGSLLTKSMKKFHDISIKLSDIDVDNIIID